MLRSSMRSPWSRGGFRARALPAAAVAVLMLGLASCGDSEQEQPTTAPVPTSSSSDGGGEASDGRGDATDGGGDSDEDKDDGVAGTAAPEASDGGGNRITMTKDDFPPPNPADYPGMNTHTEQGAIATAKYYWSLFYWVSWSGEFSTIAPLVSDDCGGCEKLRENANEAYLEGVYPSPSNAAATGAEIDSDDPRFEIVVYMRVDEILTASGLSGREDHLNTAQGLEWTGEKWEIVEIESYSAVKTKPLAPSLLSHHPT